jgi:PEP-CTERM putative exosortase interaction domain
MLFFRSIAGCLTVLVAAVLLSRPTHAALVITEVMSSSAHGSGSNNGDWFELTNTGPVAVDITGWSWDDDSMIPGSAFFGGLTSIAAGQSIIISEEPIGSEAQWSASWGITGVTVLTLGGSNFRNFGANGDAIYIFDANDNLVTSVSFGVATQGHSFQWDMSGEYLGTAVVGEYGAFRAVSNGEVPPGPGIDVGSPGFALVPEPSTIALLALTLGAGVLAGFRRPLRRA